LLEGLTELRETLVSQFIIKDTEERHRKRYGRRGAELPVPLGDHLPWGTSTQSALRKPCEL
jgi:hypothetical protein